MLKLYKGYHFSIPIWSISNGSKFFLKNLSIGHIITLHNKFESFADAAFPSPGVDCALRERIRRGLSVESDFMQLFRESFLLFALNAFDAILTLIWVRTGVATEGNHLMSNVLALSDYSFLGVKIFIGLTAAIVLYICADRPLARHGLTAVLSIYIGLFGIHVITGLTVFGYVPASFVSDLGQWSNTLFAVIF